MAPPFRADHVGSLLRPPELLRARAEHQAGRLSAEELCHVEDAAIRDAVSMQEEVGLEGVTDGEFRRGSWHMDFIYQIAGVIKAEQRLTIQFRNETGTLEFNPTAHRVSGKVRLEKTIFGEDFAFLKSVAKATPKLTIPSPSMVHYRGGRSAIEESVYPDLEAFWHDIAAVYSADRSVAPARLYLSAARRHQPRIS
jgi:methionine synthase II (cobalamin-independent)